MFGAEKLLGFCCEKGLECYLITNKKTRFIKEELEKLGFGKYFKKVVAAGEYAEDKPHPLACHAVFDNRRRRPAKSWSSATAKPTSKPRRLLSMTANGPNASFTIPNANTAVPNRTIR